jgi:phage FluMu gp28-like protein
LPELLAPEDWQKIEAGHAAGRISADEVLALTRYHCEHDGLFWLRYVVTRDEADPKNAVKPFPVHLEYIKKLWWLLDNAQKIVIAKSRQMMVSWCVVAYCTWHARYRPNQVILWQTKAHEDAIAMVAMPEGGFEGRAQFIESHLPDWLRVNCKISEGRIQYPNGSLFQAMAGGADKVRGRVVSVYVGDEFAHQDDQDGVFTAVAPLLQKGAKGIFISTPNGANMFATLYHGRPLGEDFRG